jgi:hypothetical protein
MDKRSAIAAAVKAVAQAVEGADAQDMLSRRPKPKVEPEVEGSPGEGCEDCKAGACVEHMDESALSSLMQEG